MKNLFRMLCLLVPCLCTAGVSALAAEGRAGPVPVIEAEELKTELHSKSPPVLIDVRTPEEHAAAAIEGDKNIPLGELTDHIAEIPKDKPIVVYCRSGNRSARAVALLKEKGFKDVKSLNGGIGAWGERVDPSKRICC